ncbi:hypothetical protein TNCV_4806831 [Trichonephila clavipes]|nr:hypothetical protein TNCV_4806831 [Trichonephila clavipes]
MPSDRQRPDQGPRNSSWQRAKRRLSLAVDLSTIQINPSSLSMRYEAIIIERVFDLRPTLILQEEGRLIFVNRHRNHPSPPRLLNKLRCDDEIREWSGKQWCAGQRFDVAESCRVLKRVFR